MIARSAGAKTWNPRVRTGEDQKCLGIYNISMAAPFGLFFLLVLADMAARAPLQVLDTNYSSASTTVNYTSPTSMLRETSRTRGMTGYIGARSKSTTPTVAAPPCPASILLPPRQLLLRQATYSSRSTTINNISPTATPTGTSRTCG